ncbi:MAG: endolytic transglycosylase MltG [Desulfamplus sp.]|nr:endolytic transglycosylase MltG [Desulfamplus sp.]
MKKILIGLFITTLIIAASVAGFILYLQHFAITPAHLPSKISSTDEKPYELLSQISKQEEYLITVNQGESLRNVAKKLEDAAIITNQHLFVMLARYKGDHRKIKTGEYEFLAQYTPEKILDMLVKGKVKLHKITIPEGLNMREVAAVVEKAGFGTSNNFITVATDPNFIKSLGIEHIQADSLEGYLFPETYLFPAGTDQKKIISSMVERFNKVFINDWRDVSKKLGFSVHQIVILASIIEKETANSNERPLISSVFHNRLKRGMRLESDPTVIYGIADFNGNITKKDLLAATPYNTYAIDGLPAGPIANPGRLSLQAAVFPEKSEFIFFVSKNDTTHQFSNSLKAHNIAVRKYQLKR